MSINEQDVYNLCYLQMVQKKFILQCIFSTHQFMKLQGNKQDFLTFVHDDITQQFTFSPRLNPKPSGLDSISRLTGRNHFPSKRQYEGSGQRRSSKSKKCHVCWARRRKTTKGAAAETTWVCSDCPTVY